MIVTPAEMAAMIAPGLGWINAYTIASEIGNIERFPSPAKLCGYTGLCPRVVQSGATDRRGPISKHGPRYLRWALFEAALNACKHPLYRDRYRSDRSDSRAPGLIWVHGLVAGDVMVDGSIRGGRLRPLGPRASGRE